MIDLKDKKPPLILPQGPELTSSMENYALVIKAILTIIASDPHHSKAFLVEELPMMSKDSKHQAQVHIDPQAISDM